MVRQKASTTKRAATSGSPDKPRRRARVPAAKEHPSLHTVHQIKEVGKQTHLRAVKTRETYSRHVRRACSWLQVHSDPGFRNAFERMLNQCSDKALALYLSWRGFQENCSQSTIDGIWAAFKMLWDEADGATFRGDWHHNDTWHRWEGNPVRSAEVDDVIASIRHKVSSEGAERTHSGAMKKEYMDRILTWLESRCPLDFPLEYICLAMMGFQALSPGQSLSKNAKLMATRHLQHLACGAIAFTLWTRNYELVKLKRGDINLDKTIIDGVSYFEIHLKNRKGWQRKLDKGMRESDLRSNHYRIYPRPDMGRVCDSFLCLLIWMKWVEYVHLGQPMAEDDFLFPAIGANGVLQPGEPLSHDMVQKWIDEAIVGAGIPGTFSTHCYRRGGAQYRFMFAPVGQRWTLARVRWWGGWAEGEHRDTLMRYLLDELHCYENDHSDALGPISHEADGSFAGEAALVQPASTEALNMAHASLTADVAALHTKVEEISSSQVTNMNEIRQRLSNISNLVTSALTPDLRTLSIQPCQHCNACWASSLCSSLLYQLTNNAVSACRCSLAWSTTSLSPTIQPTPATLLRLPPTSLRPTQFMTPRLVQPLGTSALVSLSSQVGPQRTVRTRASDLPQGLLILNVPILHVNGMRTLKADSWRDIVCHWTEGEPQLGLRIPLKDWPHHYYNGPHGRKFNTKYYQRSVVATEFLNEFRGDEQAFLKAYGRAAGEGHTRLLKAILDAHKQHRGDGERRRHFANDVCGRLLNATEQQA
ncbi:hypothetical protein EDC04DRAFT_2577386 [Pisolithus marmoratus]|nr:hypothetical protein EDC04DRAFT_2577386 [Pisolithus marmoratus]